MQSNRERLPVRPLPGLSVIDQNGRPRVPTLAQQVHEFFESLNVFRDKRRLLSLLFELYHFGTFGLAVVYFGWHFSLTSVASLVVLLVAFANLWNTVWYHRYCSHRAFAFRTRWAPTVLLWLNPIGFREEIYALLHHPHHAYTDTARDPYGPHLGPIGSYVASGRFAIDTALTGPEYDRLKGLIRHVPIVTSSLAVFQRWGSVEAPLHYLLRFTFANLFWFGVNHSLFGIQGVLVWYTAVFLFTLLMRDFNYRGHHGTHRDGWDFDRSNLALNQWFYGLLASEWHNNHHMFPSSARNGFLARQVDLSFWIIVAFKHLGLVERFNDQLGTFRERVARGRLTSAPIVEHSGGGR
jgi:fatty-acid desaturase